MQIQNEKTYATEMHPTHKLVVEFILDPVPGAWHQPQDLMKWLCTHNYVKSVTLVEEKDNV